MALFFLPTPTSSVDTTRRESEHTTNRGQVGTHRASEQACTLHTRHNTKRRPGLTLRAPKRILWLVEALHGANECTCGRARRYVFGSRMGRRLARKLCVATSTMMMEESNFNSSHCTGGASTFIL